MKKVLVSVVALILAICAFAIVGCGGKEGVSYEDFKAKADSIKATAPEYTKGTVWFKFGTEEEWGPDIDFEFNEEGELELDEEHLKMYSPMAWEEIEIFSTETLGWRCYVWNVTDTGNKKEEGEYGKTTEKTVYKTSGELSVKFDTTMETKKGTKASSTRYRKYDPTTGHIIEHYFKSNTGSVVNMKIVWEE